MRIGINQLRKNHFGSKLLLIENELLLLIDWGSFYADKTSHIRWR